MEILISGTSMSVEDKHRADAAPAGELPKLTDQQREVARKFGMSDEAWARALLAFLEYSHQATKTPTP